MLLEVEPDRFFVTDHYRKHDLVLVRPEKLDMEWAKGNLIRVWRAQAPKRVSVGSDLAYMALHEQGGVIARGGAGVRGHFARYPARRGEDAAQEATGPPRQSAYHDTLEIETSLAEQIDRLTSTETPSGVSSSIVSVCAASRSARLYGTLCTPLPRSTSERFALASASSAGAFGPSKASVVSSCCRIVDVRSPSVACQLW